MEAHNAPTTEQIESVFANWAGLVDDGEWETTRLEDTWVIFTNREIEVQAEIGYRAEENEVVVKVYDIPVCEGETHLDVTINADNRRKWQNQTPIDVVRDEGMTVAGALNKATN